MDVFSLREGIVGDYARFTRSFTKVAAPDIRTFLDHEYERGRFWPAPLIQLNPSFVPGATVQELVREGVLHEECGRIFRIGKDLGGPGEDLRLHRHQEEAIRIAQAMRSYVLTTGTGSGKSLSYFIPIVDRALRRGKGEPQITAIVVYPMNALCNSQLEELRKFLEAGYPAHAAPVTFARYTGQESQPERDALARCPPDILLTNYMMLELILTRQNETDQAVMRAARGLDFLVLDELHTYRGRQGADVALLVRRVREACNIHLLAVGTSATMASEGAAEDRSRVVAAVATRMFGVPVHPEDLVTETLARVTPEGSEQDAAVLATAIDDSVSPEVSFEELRRRPLAAWIETELGLQREEGKWVRTRQPQSVRSAAERLAGTAGRPVETCERVLKDFLLQAHATRDADGRSLFAFRLHQFVTGGGDLFGTLEPAESRYFTLNGQQYQPGTGREKRLFTYCFCRECGQEYLPVWATEDGAGIAGLDPRDLDDRTADDAELIHGFFMPDPEGRYGLTPIEEAFPEDWLSWEGGEPRLRPYYRKQQPRSVRVPTLFVEGDDDAKIVASAWQVFFPAEPMPFKVVSAGGTMQMRPLAVAGKALRSVIGDRLLLSLADNDGEGRDLWREGKLHQGGKWMPQTNGVWWCLLLPSDEFRDVMAQLKIDPAYWPFTIENAFPAALRAQALAEGTYALAKVPQADLLKEQRISTRVLEALADLPQDDPAVLYLRRPTPEAKDAFAAWITDPARLTRANYAALEPIFTGLKLVIAQHQAEHATADPPRQARLV